jgi:hypothetical protein
MTDSIFHKIILLNTFIIKNKMEVKMFNKAKLLIIIAVLLITLVPAFGQSPNVFDSDLPDGVLQRI